MNFPGKSWFNLIFVGLSLMLGACSSKSVQDHTQLSSTQRISTLAPAATLIPSSTLLPLLSATLIPTNTPSPPPTRTPTSTPTETPTPTPDICVGPGSVITGTYPSQLAGPVREYRIYLPPCYGEDGYHYPALYMFHGSASTSEQWDEIGIDDAADELIASGEIPPLIIIMPDGGYIANNSSGGPFSFEGVILAELIPHMEATYCAWPEPAGRALGGLSRGAYWALEIAFRNARYFTSVGAHSAALVDTHAGPDLNPQYTGLSNDLGHLRIYLDIGSEDWFIGNTQQLHQDMERANKPHTWVLNEGRHEDSYWAEHTADYLRWYSMGWPYERSDYPPCTLAATD